MLGAATASFASTPPAGGKPMQGPFYNPATNSYFQLYRHAHDKGSYNWAAAHIQAQRHFHNGERGRLAIVGDLETLRFVRDKFHIDRSTWIGLRFFCKFRKLLWVNGRVQSPSAPGMWHSQWFRNHNINCNRGLQDQHYMPVYLTGTDRSGLFWQASGPKKAFYYYLVEFAGPEKPQDVSSGKADDMTMPTGADTPQ